MYSKVLIFVSFAAFIALSRSAPAEQNNGKYQVSQSNQIQDGKYRPQNDGKYNPTNNQEGRYIHSAPPYRHVHDNRELGKYVHIPYPYDGGYGPYAGRNIPYVHDDRPYDILFNYDDEGRHKILHQEEKRKHDKYDHAYLTENGIYGEEQAKLHHRGGTHATGYYEYTGDDGQLYRVNYKSNHHGFVPEGDHIPTAPPVPDAIARALKYVDEKRKAHGEQPIFDHRGFRIDNMPKEMWDEIRNAQRELAAQDQRKREYLTTTEDGVETTTLYFL